MLTMLRQEDVHDASLTDGFPRVELDLLVPRHVGLASGPQAVQLVLDDVLTLGRAEEGVSVSCGGAAGGHGVGTGFKRA